MMIQKHSVISMCCDLVKPSSVYSRSMITKHAKGVSEGVVKRKINSGMFPQEANGQGRVKCTKKSIVHVQSTPALCPGGAIKFEQLHVTNSPCADDYKVYSMLGRMNTLPWDHWISNKLPKINPIVML